MKKTITIFQGSGKEELLKRLAEIDDITTIDNFVLNNQSAEIILHRAEGGCIGSYPWMMPLSKECGNEEGQ